MEFHSETITILSVAMLCPVVGSMLCLRASENNVLSLLGAIPNPFFKENDSYTQRSLLDTSSTLLRKGAQITWL